MRKAMKILLAVDGSEASLAAVEEVARTPWPEGSMVSIVSVAEVPFAAQQWAAPMPSGYYGYNEEWERSGFLMYTTQAMARFVDIVGARIKVTAKTIMGDPKIAILEEAEHWGADLTIDGSEFSFQRRSLPSVDENLALIRPQEAEREPQQDRFAGI
jgi:nucleotide-binding universal stress UspA family protein